MPYSFFEIVILLMLLFFSLALGYVPTHSITLSIYSPTPTNLNILQLNSIKSTAIVTAWQLP